MPPRHTIHARAKSLLGLLLTIAAFGAVGAEFEFRFWPGPGAEKDSRFVDMDDHPCGQVATARVRSMPRYSKGGLFTPERVLELNTRGKVIRRWAIPVDATPYAIAGDELLFVDGESLYKVSTTLAVSKLKGHASKLQSTASSVQCVAPREFAPSAFVGCWQFNDLRSGSKRVLAFEGVCS